MQVEEQPSPDTILPSSQAFFFIFLPSPHVSMHTSFDAEEPPLQVNPFSTLHVAEQPSRLALFPSSHP